MATNTCKVGARAHTGKEDMLTQAPVQHYNGCTAGELYPFPVGAQQSHTEGFYYLDKVDKEQWLNNTCSLEIYRPISQRVVCNSITIQ